MSHEFQSEYHFRSEMHGTNKPKLIAGNVKDDYGTSASYRYLVGRRKGSTNIHQSIPTGKFHDTNPVCERYFRTGMLQ
jgi:hypothetical protein